MSKLEDTELFELCKEVYERTKWMDESLRSWSVQWIKSGEGSDTTLYKHVSIFPLATIMAVKNEHGTPLYSSDYLLGKLPFRTKYTKGDGNIEKNYCYLALTYADNGQRVATYENRKKEWIEPFYADTPLKALLKLVIALHDAGIKL